MPEPYQLLTKLLLVSKNKDRSNYLLDDFFMLGTLKLTFTCSKSAKETLEKGVKYA